MQSIFDEVKDSKTKSSPPEQSDDLTMLAIKVK